jgi:hypothetical protein
LRPLPPGTTPSSTEESTKPSELFTLVGNEKLDEAVVNNENTSFDIKKKLDRKLRKVEKSQNKAKQKQPIIKVEKYKTCGFCKNPRSNKCDHDACKSCCKIKITKEKLICNGHGFYLSKKLKDILIEENVIKQDLVN